VNSVSVSSVANIDIVVGSAPLGNGCGWAVASANYSAPPFEVASDKECLPAWHVAAAALFALYQLIELICGNGD
jgi:hypothetical protein